MTLSVRVGESRRLPGVCVSTGRASPDLLVECSSLKRLRRRSSTCGCCGRVSESPDRPWVITSHTWVWVNRSEGGDGCGGITVVQVRVTDVPTVVHVHGTFRGGRRPRGPHPVHRPPATHGDRHAEQITVGHGVRHPRRRRVFVALAFAERGRIPCSSGRTHQWMGAR